MSARTQLSKGDAVRYRPGAGTYGYEDQLDDDGRIAATVMGFTAARVRIQFTKPGRLQRTIRAVEAESLIGAQ